MTIRFQQVTDLGAHEAVMARGLPQSSDLLDAFCVTGRTREAILVLQTRQLPFLVSCHKTASSMREDVDRILSTHAVSRLSLGPGGAMEVPTIIDLESRTASFLQSAKAALALVGGILEPFFDVRHEHNFNAILAWAERHATARTLVAEVARRNEPSVKRIVDMRNPLEHPMDSRNSRLVVRNFEIGDGGHLRRPVWGLSSDVQLSDVAEDLTRMVEAVLSATEELLVASLLSTAGTDMVVFDLPPKDRNPRCPVRFVAQPVSRAPRTP